MPINLCLASRFYYPVYAGGAMRFRRYLPGLRARGVKTRVFTGTPARQRLAAFGTEPTWSPGKPGEMLPVELVDDVPVHRLQLPEASGRRRDMLYGHKLYQFCQGAYQPDVIQFLPLQLWYFPALLRLRLSGMPLVATYNLLEKRPSVGFKQRWQNVYWRFPYQLTDMIIVNSRLMRETLRNAGVRTPVTVIPNGVDSTRYCPDENGRAPAEIRRSLGLAPTDILLLNVGSVEPRKGTDILLEAWGHLAQTYDNVHLALVGPRPDQTDPALASFGQKVQQLTAVSGAADRVHFTGEMADVVPWLQAADLFVFTSRREGLPNVVLEAMATAVPVVLTPYLGLSDELGQAGVHYELADWQPEAVADAVSRLIEDRERRGQLGAAGRDWVLTHMDMEQSLTRLMAVYQELVVSKKGLSKSKSLSLGMKS